MYHLTTNKKTHQSAELIFNALCELMVKKDYSLISITELVEQAGVGRATFYRLFDSIDDVLMYKCDYQFLELQESIKSYRRSESLTGEVKSTKLLIPILRFWYIDSIIIDVIIKANRVDILHQNIERFFEVLFDKLDRGSSVKTKKDYFISIRSGILFNILITWVKNNKNISPDELASVILEQINEVSL
jgi:AcrR family transcriptional regulator